MNSTPVSASSIASSATTEEKPPGKPAVKRPATSRVRTASKAAVKAPARAARKAAPKAVSPVARKMGAKQPAPPVVAAAAPEKPVKPPKVRLVRDSFTMPESDFALVAVLKARAVGQGRAAKKSELLRAGLQLLNQQDPKMLVAALERLQPIKTGRPKRGD